MKTNYAMKTIVFSCLIILLANQIDGQVGQWTWMKGDSVARKKGIYGVRNIASDSSKPASRSECMGWMQNNQFWLFGGWSRDNSGNQIHFNDLWRYDFTANVWTWIKGDSVSNIRGTYGVLGVEADSNKPGCRLDAMTWSDNAGNLWLFGGTGYYSPSTEQLYNDVWKYSTSTNMWTWVKGESTNIRPNGNYGTKNVSNASNFPGGRNSSMSWTDSFGNFWMFGGVGGAFNDFGPLNDLWKYSPTSNEWVWIKGDSIINSKGHYGIKGVGNSLNNPPARELGLQWKDTDGNFWLFGGIVLDSRFGNDLWKYYTQTNEWVWMNGDTTINCQTVYGTLGVSSPLNNPGCRVGSYTWTDKSGNLWLWGGDLWKYTISTNEWTWMGGNQGSTTVPVFGSLGVPALSNTPGSRGLGCSFKDSVGNFWLFGGSLYGGRNDLWRYITDTTTFPLHLLAFTAKKANTTNLLNWTTTQEINTDRFEIERSNNGREFSKIGSVKAKTTLQTNSYQYSDEVAPNSPLWGAGGLFYRLKMLDKDGQFTYSPIRQININHSTLNIAVYPNPAKDNLQLQIESDKNSTLNLQILSQEGKVVLSKQVVAQQGSSMESINISKLAVGHYFLKATTGDKESVVVGFEKAP